MCYTEISQMIKKTIEIINLMDEKGNSAQTQALGAHRLSRKTD